VPCQYEICGVECFVIITHRFLRRYLCYSRRILFSVRRRTEDVQLDEIFWVEEWGKVDLQRSVCADVAQRRTLARNPSAWAITVITIITIITVSLDLGLDPTSL
jgi:hypothetical protein